MRRAVAKPLHSAWTVTSGHRSAQMADRDDAAGLHSRGESPSDPNRADQSLRASATATATGGSGSAEERPSGVLKLAAEDSSADAAAPSYPVESSLERTAIQRPLSESTTRELEVTALRLELAQLQQTLEEEEEEGEVEQVEAGDDVAVAATTANDGDIETVVYRVISFGGGTYRGQVQARGSPEQNDWRPHGLGVLTTATGHTRCGQWLNGTQVHHGTHFSPTLHYEGDFGTSTTAIASCRGVGLYAFGALFAGSWDLGVAQPEHIRPRPRGLGILQSSTATKSVDGWVHGLHCAHQYPSEVPICTFKLSLSVRSQPQPQRGLRIADEKLQYWRRHALIRALSTWTRLCCEFSVTQARRSRLFALQTQAQARQAEQRAINDNLERQKAVKGQESAELLALLAKSREAHEQRNQRRQLYAQRLASAIKQRDLARACVAKQDNAVKTLEIELQDVTDLLEEARYGQDTCAQYARELHLLKRQIENVSVKLNAVRFDQERQRGSQQKHESQPSLSHRSAPATPTRKTPRQREDIEDNNSDSRSRGGTSVTLGQQFVCGVPGCMCGLPRDVFVRVAAALNDE